MNELEKLQDLVQNTEVLINDELQEVVTEQEAAETFSEFAVAESQESIIQHALVIAELFEEAESQESIVQPQTKRDLTDVKIKDANYFKCSILSCQNQYMDEACKECVKEYNMEDMHYCEDHSLHSKHKLQSLAENSELVPIERPEVAESKKLTLSESNKILSSFGGAVTEFKSYPADNTTLEDNTFDDDEEDESNISVNDEHQHVYNLLKSIQ
jgi:hypothetical protein